MAILAAILFPAFSAARGSARKTTCLSNLHQIGLSIGAYTQDYDGLLPFAVNPSDRAHPDRWSDNPDFQAAIPILPQLHEILQPYLKSRDDFHCPSDAGLHFHDPFPGWELDASPSSYAVFGTSYFYRTKLAAEHARMSTLNSPSGTTVLSDADGKWHGSTDHLLFETAELRYNALFADTHVKSISHQDLARLDAEPL
jgi:general secretion pathway protein G